MEKSSREKKPNGVKGSAPRSTERRAGSRPAGMVRERQASPGRHPATVSSADPEATTAATEATSAGSKVRRKWSTQENLMVMRCYLQCQPERRGYRKRMHEIWRKNGMVEVSEQRLCDQLSTIKRCKWFSDVQIEELKKELVEHQSTVVQACSGEGGLTSPCVNGESNGETLNEVTHNHLGIEREQVQVDVMHDLEPLVELANNSEHAAVIQQLNAVLQSDQSCRLPSLRSVAMHKLLEEVGHVNGALAALLASTREYDHDISKLNRLIYAGAYVVCERLGKKVTSEAQKRENEKWWRVRIVKKIARLRKDLSRLEEAKSEKLKRADVFQQLQRRYHVLEKGLVYVIEEVKQRLMAESQKLRRFDEKILRYQQNKTFETNQGRVYRDLREGGGGKLAGGLEGKDDSENELDAEKARGFWEGIWGMGVQHNAAAEWIQDVASMLEGDVSLQDDLVISLDMVRKFVGKMPNWKAPGPDHVQWFWVKKFTSLHGRVATALNRCLCSGNVPEWMNVGKTVLIQKDPDKGVAPSNYRPITCLPVMWKLFSGVMSDSIYEHLDEKGLFPLEQKGCKRGSYGTKDQLMVNKAVLTDCRRRKTNLAMAWVDYRKAYDMVPHDWILRCLQLFGVAKNVQHLLMASMAQCRVELWNGRKCLGSVGIRRGIFQGDSLSPLLFVLSLIPISMVLRRLESGYRFKDEGKTCVNHLWYMDDLKLFAGNERGLHSLLHTVRVCSSDIAMEFGVDKCAVILLKRGKHVSTDGISLPDGRTIRALNEGDWYKYLGFAEADGVLEDQVKSKILLEYKWRVRKVLRSKLNGTNVVRAINSWAVALVRYSGGILQWTKKELDDIDRKTRKLLTMHGGLHPRADVDRLYVSRLRGGRGLLSVHDAIEVEERNLQRYVLLSREPLLKAAGRVLLANVELPPRSDVARQQAGERRFENWKEKPMHGQFVRQTCQYDNKDSWTWLRSSGLTKETESLITAAQDQALRTNMVKARIEKRAGTDPRCRMCRTSNETVTHILSQCPKLAGSDYKYRHDRVAGIIHWSLCKRYGFECSASWFDHQTERVLESDKGVKILWDFSLQTDHYVECRRPDIVVVDRPGRKALVIDIAIPGDFRVEEKEVEKREKYVFLAQELQRIWNISVTVVPIVVGSLGVIPRDLEKWLKSLEIDVSVGLLQKVALLGSARILRKVLDIREI